MIVNGECRIAWEISDRERRIMRQLSREKHGMACDPDDDLRDFMGAGHADR